jgi:hypothetical protein
MIGGLALVLSIAVGWKSRLELQSARREIVVVTRANEFLKKTLGDMTVAVTARAREIDRLQRSGCDWQEKVPSVPIKPQRNKVSESDAVGAGSNQRTASAEGANK